MTDAKHFIDHTGSGHHVNHHKEHDRDQETIRQLAVALEEALAQFDGTPLVETEGYEQARIALARLQESQD